MKTIGGYLAFFGIGSIVLNMIGYELMLVSWADNWGPTVGWGIRIGMIVVGGLLYFMGKPSADD